MLFGVNFDTVNCQIGLSLTLHGAIFGSRLSLIDFILVLYVFGMDYFGSEGFCQITSNIL